MSMELDIQSEPYYLPPLILDFDGVIHDDPHFYKEHVITREKVWCEKNLLALKAAGENFPFNFGITRDLAGTMLLIDRVYEGQAPDFEGKLELFFREVYQDPENPIPYHLIKPAPELAKAIRAYRDVGGQVVIYSNVFSCYMEEIFSKLGLERSDFDHIEVLNEHLSDFKPSLDGFVKFLAAAGIEPNEDNKYDAVYIDDTPRNIDAGWRAGVKHNVWFNSQGKSWPKNMLGQTEECNDLGNLIFTLLSGLNAPLRPNQAEVFSFHQRRPYDVDDSTKVFSSYLCSEKPDIAKLSPAERRLHELRHFAKKGCNPDGSGQVDPRHDADESILRQRIGAAKAVVEALLTDAHVEELADHIYKRLGDRKQATVTFLRNSVAEDCGKAYNFLSPVYDEILSEKLRAKFDEKYPDAKINFEIEIALRLNDTQRVYSGPMVRLVRQPYIDTQALEKIKNKIVIISDEHVQAAGMTATLYTLAKEAGAEVIGITSLTAHPTTRDVRPDPETTALIREVAGCEVHNLEKCLQEIGISFETLTPREGLYILALLMDGHNLEHKASFENLVERLSEGVTVVEGTEDDIFMTLSHHPMSVAQFNNALRAHIAERPKTFIPVYAL